ncbi:probable O-glycosylation ligase, exosortase A-associated [Noviherbaspirillum humi]|uniref:Probable O-glycosylation ligase, exosortase A-associated n=1 Tax=Noviherbaspirillum humi TaxID=1688639 RepID=A0A239HKP0_9BURK|nr:putative O-glycosylation ligase, exosortase A system-associated [Noviherbaspirillum humi]SNS81648.1 probable O-glycosylation ligase, exosortase A-associated [Noviherbaspirillum humi]
MRDLIIFVAIFGSIPFIFKRPAVGVIVFTWISLMNPHRLTYGSAYAFPFAALIAAVTLLSVVFSRQPKQFPLTPVTTILLIFIGWMNFTSLFALEPNLVWVEWERVMKTLFMILIAIAVFHSEKDIKQFTWIVAMSLAFYGLKGGIFTVLSGGSYRVLGPDGSYIAENNSLALALVTILPLVWYLRLQAANKWMKRALTAIVVFTAISAMGSYSRGALLGGAGMMAFLWMKSHKKAQTLIVLVLAVLLICIIMPDQWFARMQSIDDYQKDGSALGRINAWHFAINIATERLVGGGFNVFTPNMFMQYAPDPRDFHVAHSIFFQVLGDHGAIGLVLFVLLMIFSWRTGTRVIRATRDQEELKWANDLAKMCQVSIVGYAISGAFLSLAYYDLYYNIIVILIVLEKAYASKPNRIASQLHPTEYARIVTSVR